MWLFGNLINSLEYFFILHTCPFDQDRLFDETIYPVATPEIAEVAIYYGNFINTIITFIVVAFAVFMIVRSYTNYMKKKEEAPAPAEPPKPTREEELLTEIRDALKK